LQDESRFVLARVTALTCLRAIANQAEPEIYVLIEGVLIEELKRHDAENVILSSFIAQTLIGMGSTAGAKVIDEAFAAGKILPTIAGEWEEARAELGLEPPPSWREKEPLLLNDDESDMTETERSEKKAAARKKAKRKQAARSRKQNRQRKKKR
jgi:hypothetical protein